MRSSTFTTVQLGDVFESSNQRLGDHLEEPPVFAISKYDGVVLGSDYHERRVASERLHTYKVLKPEDWAYSTIHIDEGSIARNNHEFLGVVSPMYTILRWKSPDHDPQYFERLLRSQAMLATYSDMAQGSINRRRSLPWKTFASIKVSVPPLREQQRIVDVLDGVDAAIEATRAVQANANNTYRAIAENLTGPLVPLGRLLIGIDTGKSPSGVERTPHPDERAVLKVSAVGPDGFRPEEVKVVSPGTVLKPASAVAKSDVLMVRANGVLSRVGAVCMVDQDYPNLYLCDKTLRLVPDSASLDSHWLLAALKSSRSRAQIESLSTGSDMRNIGQAAIMKLSIPAPPRGEQDALSSVLSGFASVNIELAKQLTSLTNLRDELLSALLSGAHRIPETYDELMGA